MIVDDDVDILQSVGRYLTEVGYEVLTAKSAAEALRAIRTFIPDVLLLDLIMPGMSGTELMVRLRETGIQVPIIIITADTEAPRKLRGHRQQGLLVKPFNFAEMREAIDQLAARPPALRSEAGGRR